MADWNSTRANRSAKQNIIQSGAFSSEYIEDVSGALTSLKMAANFILQLDGLAYFTTDSTSDAQFKYDERAPWL